MDPVTGQVKHDIRGKDGQIPTPLELEKEKPLFENAILIDIGDKHPFYDDYIAGTTATASSEEVKTCTQISLVGHSVPQCGDVLLLKTLWNQIGVAANHKEPFSPLEWGATTLTVSILFFPILLASLGFQLSPSHLAHFGFRLSSTTSSSVA